MKYIYDEKDIDLLEKILADYCIPQPDGIVPHYIAILQDTKQRLCGRADGEQLTNNRIVALIKLSLSSMLRGTFAFEMVDKINEDIRPVVISVYEKFILSVRDSLGEKSLYSSFINSTMTKPQAERLIKRLFSLYLLQDGNESLVSERDLDCVQNVLNMCGDVTVFDIVNILTPVLISDENPQSSAWLSNGFQVYLPRVFGYDMSNASEKFLDLGNVIPAIELGMLSPYFDINILLFHRLVGDEFTLDRVNCEALTFSPNTNEVITHWRAQGHTYIHDILSRELSVRFSEELFRNNFDVVLLSYLVGRHLNSLKAEVPFILDGSKLNLSPNFKFIYLNENGGRSTQKSINDMAELNRRLEEDIARFLPPMQADALYNSQELRVLRSPIAEYVTQADMDNKMSRRFQ